MPEPDLNGIFLAPGDLLAAWKRGQDCAHPPADSVWRQITPGLGKVSVFRMRGETEHVDDGLGIETGCRKIDRLRA